MVSARPLSLTDLLRLPYGSLPFTVMRPWIFAPSSDSPHGVQPPSCGPHGVLSQFSSFHSLVFMVKHLEAVISASHPPPHPHPLLDHRIAIPHHRTKIPVITLSQLSHQKQDSWFSPSLAVFHLCIIARMPCFENVFPVSLHTTVLPSASGPPSCFSADSSLPLVPHTVSPLLVCIATRILIAKCTLIYVTTGFKSLRDSPLHSVQSSKTIKSFMT